MREDIRLSSTHIPFRICISLTPYKKIVLYYTPFNLKFSSQLKASDTTGIDNPLIPPAEPNFLSFTAHKSLASSLCNPSNNLIKSEF